MPTPEPPPSVLPPGADRAEEEAPAAPSIPSFASLRAPRGRSAVDVLLPGASAPPSPAPAVARSAGPAPRPAEYADLLRFGVRVMGSVADVSWQLAGRALRAPGYCLRRLLG